MGLLISDGWIYRALVLLILCATSNSSSYGQNATRSYVGWNTSSTSSRSPVLPNSARQASLLETHSSDRETQYRANFATQNGMPGLPPIPAGVGASNAPAASFPAMPGGSIATDALSNSSGAYPGSAQGNDVPRGLPGQGPAGTPRLSSNPTQPSSSFSLASSQRSGGEVLPPRQPDFGTSTGQGLAANNFTSSRQQGNVAAQPTAYPSVGSAAGGPSASDQGGDGLRPIGQPSPKYVEDLNRYPNQYPGQFGSQNGLRQIAGGQAIATGLPYVTPPPNNVGRYATSPYSGTLYRNASYQMVSAGPNNSVNAQLASNLQASGQSAQSLVPAQNQGLPQYRNVGIYPTAYQQCNPGPANYPPPGAVPGNYLPPTYTPDVVPGVYSTNNAGYSPLFSLGQENYNVQLGRGIIGQPTVYVPSQPFRNFIRYLSP